MCKLDIVVPVYNEGRNIIDVMEALRRSVRTPFRVLICYDYDGDDTLRALREYGNSHFEIQLVKNRGVGVHGAVLTGFSAATAPAVLVFPADDTYNAQIIDEMFKKFEEGCDVVAASRFLPGGCMKGCPLLKAMLVRAAAFTLYHFARLPTRDPTNGFRLFSRRGLEQIKVESSEGFAYSLELLVKCHRLGWRVGEVAALWYQRTRGKSRFRVFKWLPVYLRWYFYAFGTTFLRRGADTVVKNMP